MTFRRSSKRAKPRWLGLGAVVVMALGLAASAALAVHDEDVFELDGDPETAFHLNNNSDPDTSHDWDQVYDPGTYGSSGAEAETFITDFVGQGDDILFGGATKDINDLPAWAWKQTTTTSVQDKDDIEHAFAAQYLVDRSGDSGEPGCGPLLDTEPASEFCVLLYFGADRFSNDGDTTMGFWFFHDEVTADDTTFTFDGQHTARVVDPDTDEIISRGDVLIVTDFLTGGQAPTVTVFEWVESGGSASTHLDLIGGSDVAAAGCNGGPAPKQNATPVPAVGANDPLCATVNQAIYDPTIWPFTPKANTGAPNTYPVSTFMEGGINLTALGFGNDCFASFLAETRASHAPTSTLSDFAVGTFGECESDITTTPADGGGTDLTDTDSDLLGLPDTQSGTGSAGVYVTDTADVTVTGVAQWSGTVDFFICGPIADPATCDTGGVAAGTKNVDQGNTSATSDSVNLTEVGRYCWRGEFVPSTESAAGGVEGATDAELTECFEVLPVEPTLDTVAVDSEGNALTDDVPFGQAVYDKATLSGTAYQPGTDGADATYPSINATMDTPANGTITFTLIGPDDCATTATGTGSNPEDVTVSDDGDYFTSGFTPDLPGDYHWQAVYSGDSPNTLGASHNDGNDGNAACSDTDEDVTVEQLQPTMDTAQDFVPNDSATITVGAGAGDLDGYVVFDLFVDDNTCAGSAAYTSGQIAVSDTDDPGDLSLSNTVSSDNTTAYNVSGTTFHWVVTFTSNNGAHLGVTSGCGNEHSSITIDNGVTQPTPTP